MNTKIQSIAKKKCNRLISAILSILLVFSSVQMGMLKTKASDIQLSENDLKAIAADYGNTFAFEYADYDGNGTKEAFAVIVDDYDAIRKILFLSSDGKVKTIDENFKAAAYPSDDCRVRFCGGRGFFWIDYGSYGSGFSTGLYSVKNNQPYVLDLSGKIQGFYQKGVYFYTTENDLSTGNHTYRDVELIFDAKTLQFKKGKVLPNGLFNYLDLIAQIYTEANSLGVASGNASFCDVDNDGIDELFIITKQKDKDQYGEHEALHGAVYSFKNNTLQPIFKGRLVWMAGVPYAEIGIISKNGKTFICIDSRQSSTDLDGTSTEKWLLYDASNRFALSESAEISTTFSYNTTDYSQYILRQTCTINGKTVSKSDYDAWVSSIAFIKSLGGSGSSRYQDQETKAVYSLDELIDIYLMTHESEGNNTPEKQPSQQFQDVTGHWALEGINYCITHNLMNGMSTTLFAPNGTVTRAQLVTILYRSVGSPRVSFKGRFRDVGAGKWYSDAIEWAAEKGIVNGTTPNLFNPGGNITREQIAAILYRFEGSPAVSGSLSSFSDAKTVSSYAVNAMIWATKKGLITGIQSRGIMTLQPKANATRGQIATIMMRFLTD